jgi:hypothetical protein
MKCIGKQQEQWNCDYLTGKKECQYYYCKYSKLINYNKPLKMCQKMKDYEYWNTKDPIFKSTSK